VQHSSTLLNGAFVYSWHTLCGRQKTNSEQMDAPQTAGRNTQVDRTLIALSESNLAKIRDLLVKAIVHQF
jgi:hypothetical protein